MPSRKFSVFPFPKELELTHLATNKSLYLFFTDKSAFILLTGHKSYFYSKIEETILKKTEIPVFQKSPPNSLINAQIRNIHQNLP